ncbi:HypC/HybG/HupF family hydrogenase formation chaperone [Desulfobacca acetoxidans]|nr:HypC/HybG/HupF family hydrogenase formation chaperone [Desulfobacca acetoxidans]
MCLAIPMKIIEIQGLIATMEVDGIIREARLDLLPEAHEGDYVLVHAGLAIARVDPEQASETLALLRKMIDEIQ